MEVTPLTVYIISRISLIGPVAGGASLILFIGWAAFLFLSTTDLVCGDDVNAATIKAKQDKVGKKAFLWAVMLLVVFLLMPSRADLGAMYVAGNIDVKGVSEDIIKGIHGAAHEWALSFTKK